MSIVSQILPSDKNELEIFCEINENGTFDVNVPYTDASRRDRRVSVTHFQTLNPFVPRNLLKYYDSSTKNKGIGETQKFYILDFDPVKLRDTVLVKQKDSLLPFKWKHVNDVIETYNAASSEEKTGLVINEKYLAETLNAFYQDVIPDDFDFSEYIQLFAEVGTKVTETEIESTEFKFDKLNMDVMRMYFYHKDFYYPLITQTDHSGSVEIDIGNVPTLTPDENLRSMLRYTLLDINKMDTRSAFVESKRSVYLEYEVNDPQQPDKTITKYILVWSMGNPNIFTLEKSNSENRGYIYEYSNQKRFFSKIDLYGRLGTYTNLVGLDRTMKFGKHNSTYLSRLLIDYGFNVAPVNTTNNNENAVANIFRANWSCMFVSALIFYWKFLDNVIETPTKISELRPFVSKNKESFPDGREVFSFYYGTISTASSWIDNVRSLTLFNRPVSNISFYGNDLILRLKCDQIQTVVYGDRKRQRLQKLLATLIANEQTYQTFNGSDNKIVFQPPTFRPLLFLQQEESLIVGESNRILHFSITNVDDETVFFNPGDKIYMKLKFEAFNQK